MMRELHRHNLAFEADINPPLKYDGETKITKGSKFLYGISCFEGRLFTAATTYLICLDIQSKELLWERQSPSYIGIPVDGENNLIYVCADQSPACLSATNGKTVWKVAERESVIAACNHRIYCIDTQTKPNQWICRSKENGEPTWIQNEYHGTPDTISVENNIAVVNESEGFYAVEESSGKLIWEENYNQWLSKYKPNKTFKPPVSAGPLIDGVFYIGFNGGLLFAIKAASGELVWTYELENPDERPGTIIFHQQKIYFSIAQVWGAKNYLTCIDAKSGEMMYRTEENFTPKGGGPILAGNYLIAGKGEYLSFYDFEEQKFVWRYKHKKKKNIAGGHCVYRNRLITFDGGAKEMYWFRSKASK